MARIGVLALQGSVAEHLRMLERLGDVQGVAVRSTADLDSVNGLILPGGESTTIGKLLRIFGLSGPIRQRIANGMPVWGTCAGMILLAREIVGEVPHLAVMDIRVHRNAYGRQIDSFVREAVLPAVCARPMELVFIRAPWIEAAGDKVETLCVLDGQIVAARQGPLLATSFHPELTTNLSMHRYFASMVRESRG